MASLSISQRKFIRSLHKSSARREHAMFIAEGTKCVLDTIEHFDCVCIAARPAWIEKHANAIKANYILEATGADMERISALKTAPEVLAVYRIPEPQPLPAPEAGQLILALDCVQDPGNLGTIMRTCDWLGVSHILASPDTADVFSPKVVQATMGAISRVRVHYCNLPEVLGDYSPVYGTFLDGDDIYSTPLTSGGVVVMGNEGRGISDEVARVVSHRLFIPPYGEPGRPTSESLNVATATALALAAFRHPSTKR